MSEDIKFSAPYDFELAKRFERNIDLITIKDNYVLFYKGWPSQWFSCKFVIDGIEYNCAEQYMMAEKARLFGDELSLHRILHESSPKAQKEQGRQVSGFDVDIWNEHAKNIVYNGNYAKFSQNERLKSRLLGTNDMVLVEASPYDCVWGIGLGEDHPDATNKDKWLGKNWLGEVLMDVRNNL